MSTSSSSGGGGGGEGGSAAGGGQSRLEENCLIWDHHSHCQLVLEKFSEELDRTVNSSIQVIVSEEEDQEEHNHNYHDIGTVSSSSSLESFTSIMVLPESSLVPPSLSSSSSSSSSDIGPSILSFPVPSLNDPSSTVTIERESDLDGGLDICIMSIHGTYLRSCCPGDISVSCLDDHCTFTILDSGCLDEDGNSFKYLRNQEGEYLSADQEGRLWLEDVGMKDTQVPHNPPPPPAAITHPSSSTLFTEREATIIRYPGFLHPYHRWLVKRGSCQSLISSFNTYLTISEEGEVLLTPIRYEESCVHLCFAVIQGLLRKKNEGGIRGLKSWQKKWFVLSGSTLTYFNQQEEIYDKDNNPITISKKQQQAKNKGGISSSSLSPNTSSAHRSYSTAGILSINVYPAPSHRFDVEFVNGRVLNVKAESESDRERWVRALRNGRNSKKMDAKVKEQNKEKKKREYHLKETERIRQMMMKDSNQQQRETERGGGGGGGEGGGERGTEREEYKEQIQTTSTINTATATIKPTTSQSSVKMIQGDSHRSNGQISHSSDMMNEDHRYHHHPYDSQLSHMSITIGSDETTDNVPVTSSSKQSAGQPSPSPYLSSQSHSQLFSSKSTSTIKGISDGHNQGIQKQVSSRDTDSMRSVDQNEIVLGLNNSARSQSPPAALFPRRRRASSIG